MPFVGLVWKQQPFGGCASDCLQQLQEENLLCFFAATVLLMTMWSLCAHLNASFEQKVIGNAVFAGTALNVPAGDAFDNITDSYNNADNYLNAPFAAPGALDLHPLNGALSGSSLPTQWFTDYGFWNWDFNYSLHDSTQRGAYATDGVNLGWQLQLSRKPLPVPNLPFDLYLPLVTSR